MGKVEILAGRKAVDACREAHRQLHAGGWYKGISEDHTPLLEKLVTALEAVGVVSAETDWEAKKTEVLARFWVASDEQNVKKLGFVDRKDFDTKVREGSTGHTEIDPETGKEIEITKLTPEGEALLNSLKGMWR